MSLKKSDNTAELHPKPPTEGERKLSGTAYVDWVNQAEVTGAIPIEYRRNKYFWINGTYFHCNDDGVSFRATGTASSQPGQADFTNVYFTA